MTIKSAKRQLRKFGIEFNDANDLLNALAKIKIGENYNLSYLIHQTFKLQFAKEQA